MRVEPWNPDEDGPLTEATLKRKLQLRGFHVLGKLRCACSALGVEFSEVRHCLLPNRAHQLPIDVCLAVLASRRVSQIHGLHCQHSPTPRQDTWSPLHAHFRDHSPSPTHRRSADQALQNEKTVLPPRNSGTIHVSASELWKLGYLLFGGVIFPQPDVK